MNRDEIILHLLKEGRIRVDFETGYIYAPKSNTPNKFLGTPNSKGYLRTSLNHNRKAVCFFVHRIIWVAGHGPLPAGNQIDHVNGIKADNRACNLEAVTGIENMRRAAKAGLTNGGWRNAPRDNKGHFIGKKAASCLLDGKEHRETP